MKILELINNFFKSKRRVRFKYVGGAFVTKPRKVNKDEQNELWENVYNDIQRCYLNQWGSYDELMSELKSKYILIKRTKKS